VLYNLVQEPWLKYCVSAIADRGLKSSYWTSSRLREEVLYLETSRCAEGRGGGAAAESVDGCLCSGTRAQAMAVLSQSSAV
jgi:hypothetical protein